MAARREDILGIIRYMMLFAEKPNKHLSFQQIDGSKCLQTAFLIPVNLIKKYIILKRCFGDKGQSRSLAQLYYICQP